MRCFWAAQKRNKKILRFHGGATYGNMGWRSSLADVTSMVIAAVRRCQDDELPIIAGYLRQVSISKRNFETFFVGMCSTGGVGRSVKKAEASKKRN